MKHFFTSKNASTLKLYIRSNPIMAYGISAKI